MRNDNTIAILPPRKPKRLPARNQQHLLSLLTGCVALLGSAIAAPVNAAEKVALSLPLLGEFDLKIESLERYAETGAVDRSLGRYLRHLEPERQEQLRDALQAKAEIDGATLYRVTNTPLGEGVLRRLGTAIRTDSRSNGYLALRAAAIDSALSPEGLTLLNLMRRFPSPRIFIDTDTIFGIIQQFEILAAYRNAAVSAISAQAQAEATATPSLDFDAAPDLRAVGPFEPRKEILEIQAPGFTLGSQEIAPYTYAAEVYLPDSKRAAPLVVMSHGFASGPEYFRPLARYLASHGFAVAVPAHQGSNFDRQLSLLAGRLGNVVDPAEFVRRPRELSLLIDRFAAANTETGNWQGQILDLDRIGVVGYSLGGYTALALAGAPLNRERITTTCEDDETPTLNLSLLLQCRALPLLPETETLASLHDPRVKATIAVNPIGSTLFGPEGLSQIEIPMLVVSSSHDPVAAAIPEQIHPFASLGDRPTWQLALLVPGTHFSTSPDADLEQIPLEVRGPRADLGRGYLNALSLAFLGLHIEGCQAFTPYLGAAYSQYLNQDDPELALYTISALPPERLEAAYGRKPPAPIVPDLFAPIATAPEVPTVTTSPGCPSVIS
ncbi:MAG: alpha/beta fold hydrolase [Cyanobacteria bacterium J06641_5]